MLVPVLFLFFGEEEPHYYFTTLFELDKVTVSHTSVRHKAVHTWSGRTVQKDSSEESEDRESEWTLVRRDCMSSF